MRLSILKKPRRHKAKIRKPKTRKLLKERPLRKMRNKIKVKGKGVREARTSEKEIDDRLVYVQK